MANGTGFKLSRETGVSIGLVILLLAGAYFVGGAATDLRNSVDMNTAVLENLGTAVEELANNYVTKIAIENWIRHLEQANEGKDIIVPEW